MSRLELINNKPNLKLVWPISSEAHIVLSIHVWNVIVKLHTQRNSRSIIHDAHTQREKTYAQIFICDATCLCYSNNAWTLKAVRTARIPANIQTTDQLLQKVKCFVIYSIRMWFWLGLVCQRSLLSFTLSWSEWDFLVCKSRRTSMSSTLTSAKSNLPLPLFTDFNFYTFERKCIIKFGQD